ncbi:ARHGAP21 family protein [Megaselia abdita]
MLNSSNIIQPKVVIIRRPPAPNSTGFGFTLRHFIAYPSDDDTAIFIDQASQRKVPLETIFIKEVSPTGPAAFSGLKTGDRVIMVNNSPINGMSYNAIVQMIKTTPDVLYLHVLPKECDVLQMSYGFAHTPESNISATTTSTLHHNKLIEFPHASAAAAAAVAVPQQTLVSSHHFTTSTPGTVGVGGGMIPIYPHTKHQQPQAQQQQQHIHKNMISYSDSTYSSIQQRKAMTMSASSPLSPSSMSSSGQQHHHLKQQQSSSSNEVVYSDINPSSLALRNDGTLIRSAKPANLTVLQKQNSPDNELMIRLRKSIEQKEEFLKSPVPHPQSTFFNNNNGCNQSIMSRHSLPSSGASTSSLNSTRSRFLYNHPQPPQKSTSSLLPASYDMNNFYRQNLPIGLSDSLLAGRGSYDHFTKRISTHQNFLIHNRVGLEENMNRRKFNKDIEYLETLTELGVTNQFFERSSSHLNKGFDPFKQLTINTGGHGPLPADSIESLKRLSVNNIEPNSILPSTRNIRMETHKANLAQTKAEVYAPPKSPAISEEVIYEETIPLQNYKHDVVRRQTVSSLDDNKQLRRISYLRATTGATSPTTSMDSGIKRMSYAHEVLERSHNDIIEMNGKPHMKDVATEVEIFETEMEIKSSCILGKRISEYRSWRQVKIEIKGDILKIYPGRSSKTEANVIELDVRNCNILDESVDKKKHVFKLRSISSDLTGLEDDSSKENTEILFKTKSINEMKKVLAILRDKCATISNSSDVEKQGKQTAEPQKTAATTSTYCDDNTSGGQDYSPTSSTLEQDSISPNPRRKPSKQEKDLGSPKSKSNWKDFFSRKNHGSGTADISPSTLSSSSAKTIGSIGVPLRSCPMSKDNEYVPHIVDVCTKIVESKGLSTTGIYRVPGNKAAISELKEQVNRSDFDWDRCSTDIRWEDMNVVSSLLKQFIRDLPDALLPSTFYINFIEADKKQGERRLLELRYLLKDLPPHSYETMKHIIRHLHRISKHCDVNLMEPKNLAIIFGPSIIRTTNDTLESAVKDMKHQCRIVESLVTNYEFFFEDGELPELDTNSTISSTSTSHHDQTTLLLHNVPKIEQRNNDKESTFKRFMPNLRTRTHSKRSGVSSDTYSEESVLVI